MVEFSFHNGGGTDLGFPHQQDHFVEKQDKCDSEGSNSIPLLLDVQRFYSADSPRFVFQPPFWVTPVTLANSDTHFLLKFDEVMNNPSFHGRMIFWGFIQ